MGAEEGISARVDGVSEPWVGVRRGGLDTPTPRERRDITPWRHWRRPEGGMRGPHTGAVEGAVWVLGHHVVERVQHSENGKTIRGINFWDVGCGITEIKKSSQETKKNQQMERTRRLSICIR